MKNKGFLSRAIIGAAASHKEVASSLSPVTEIKVPIVTPQAATEAGSDPGTRPVSNITMQRTEGVRRYTLILQIPVPAAGALARHLGQFPPLRRAAARRALVSAFIAEVRVAPRFKAAPIEDPLIRLRVDIRLTDQRRDQLLAQANPGRFEPTASALARHLTPLFAAFIRAQNEPPAP